MAEDSGWCTIESDPGVFTDMLECMGVKNTQVLEMYSLDRKHLNCHGPVYGVVFLFKYRANERENAKARSGHIVDVPEGLFFANQTIINACATQALLSIVLNSTLDVGYVLRYFDQFTTGMDPMTKGMVLSNSPPIRDVHNSFAAQQTLAVEDPTGEKEDAFHFVAYVPWKGHVYELDGLQEGPRQLGAIAEENWLDLVTPEVGSRIQEYQGAEIRFNLMAVVDDQREHVKVKIESLLAKDGYDVARLEELQEELLVEEAKRVQWHIDNDRRKWNFMPMIVELLKLLARTGHAEDLINQVTAVKKEAYRKARDAKNGASSSGK